MLAWKTSCIVLASAAILFFVQNSRAASVPFYISGSAGAIIPQDYSRSVTFFNSQGATGPGHDTTTYDTGPAANLAAGMKLPLGFRVEAEGGYAHYNTATNTPTSTNLQFPSDNGTKFNLSSGGERSLYTGTLNGFFDLPMPGSVVPYIGGGVGYYHLASSDSHYLEPNGSHFVGLGGSMNDAMFLGEVGLNISVGDNWSIVPAYRYDYFLADNNANFSASIFKMGVRYAF